MATIIAIANQKGGVGKTTTAINLAACLAVAEKKTLLIDLDPQGNASVGLGLEKDSFHSANIYHAIIDEESMENVIYKTELDLLDVCPADNNLAGAEIELVSVLSRESKLKKAISAIANQYDYILIDCPPSLGLLTVNALNAANRYLVPMQTEFFAMEGLSQLMNTARLIKSALNPELELQGILLTMHDTRMNLAKQVSAEIQKYFKEEVFHTVVPRNVKLSESPSFGRPIILYDIASKGSEAYMSLAREILMRDKPVTEKKSAEILNATEPSLNSFDTHTHANVVLPSIPTLEEYSVP